MNGEWTADAIEERRWLRSLVHTFAPMSKKPRGSHHLGSDGKGGVPAPVRVKLKRAERLPGLGVTPQRDGPTSDGGRPCQQEINEPTSK
jgi:hypothetical protein